MKIYIKNQIGSGLTIEICCGDKEYTLASDEEINIEIKDSDCIYLDSVYEGKRGSCG